MLVQTVLSTTTSPVVGAHFKLYTIFFVKDQNLNLRASELLSWKITNYFELCLISAQLSVRASFTD